MTDTTRAVLAEDAFREGNLVAIGVSPTTEELAEATTLLNRTISSLIGNEIGEKLTGVPQPLPARFTWNPSRMKPDPECPPVNYKILVNQTEPFRMTWDPEPGDGARMAVSAVKGPVDVTIDANGHFIDTGDRTVLQEQVTLSMAQGESYEWFYRSDRSQWLLVASSAAGPFTTLDSSPFPVELDGLLTTYTSLRLQARFGNDPRAGTVEELKRMMRIAKARYDQRVNTITNPDVPLTPGPTEYYGGYRG